MKKMIPLKNFKNLPIGNFWYKRDDRYHCGLDFFSFLNEPIFSITDGKVINIGIFTDPIIRKYWNLTYFIIIENNNTYIKYAETSYPYVSVGQYVSEGQHIADVSKTIKKTNKRLPPYINYLYENNLSSMLHLEIWKDYVILYHNNYLAGNWFGKEKPKNLINPKSFLGL